MHRVKSCLWISFLNPHPWLSESKAPILNLPPPPLYATLCDEVYQSEFTQRSRATIHLAERRKLLGMRLLKGGRSRGRAVLEGIVG